MSAYKRFISYIFSYENGVKKENVGYARIENYNEQCRISIYMKASIKREQKASVYLFYRNNEKIQGIFMKEMTIKNGLGDCKITTESENIGDSACRFENIGGIIIYVTANRFWGTEWDDKPIYGFEPIRNDEIVLKEPVLEESVSEKTLRKNPVLEEPIVSAAVLGNQSEDLEKRWKEIKSETIDEMREEQERYYEESSGDEETGSLEESENDCFEPYTKIYPFYEPDRECIGVSPQDLVKISPILEAWQNNDFLLHGYNRFRHIILLRRKGDREEYFIGVPGMYHPNEEKLAVTYGFTMFVPMKKQKAEYGDFGYWCTKVEM